MRTRWCAIALLATTTVVSADVAPVAERAGRTPPLPSFFPVRVLWGAAFGVAPAAPPVVDAGQLYVALRTGRVVALSMDRVAYVWNVPLTASGPLAIDDGKLFVPAAGALEALDTATGTSTWRAPLPDGAVLGVTATSGWVFVALEGEVVALRAESGERVWARQLSAKLSAPPLVQADRLFAGTVEGDVLVLDVKTGEPRWTMRVEGAPVGFGLRGERLYFGTSGKQFYSLRANDGFIEWRWRIGATIIGDPGFDAQHVYVVALDNQVRALDLRSGAQRWRKPVPARPIGGAIPLGPSVIVPCLASEVRAFAAKDGANQGRYQTDAELNAMPAIVGRPLTRGGDVMAMVLSDGSALGLQRRVEPALAGLGVLPGLPVPFTPATPATAPPPRPAPPR